MDNLPNSQFTFEDLKNSLKLFDSFPRLYANTKTIDHLPWWCYQCLEDKPSWTEQSLLGQPRTFAGIIELDENIPDDVIFEKIGDKLTKVMWVKDNVIYEVKM